MHLISPVEDKVNALKLECLRCQLDSWTQFKQTRD